MAYQVTIYSEAERAAYQRNREQYGRDAADLATYSPAEEKTGFFGNDYRTEPVLQLMFRRPRTNLATKTEWIDMLERAVRHCKRKGSQQRGLSKEEFMALVNHAPSNPELEKAWRDAGKSMAKYNALRWSAPGIRVLCGTSDQLQRGLDGAETMALVKRLGWG